MNKKDRVLTTKYFKIRKVGGLVVAEDDVGNVVYIGKDASAVIQKCIDDLENDETPQVLNSQHVEK